LPGTAWLLHPIFYFSPDVKPHSGSIYPYMKADCLRNPLSSHYTGHIFLIQKGFESPYCIHLLILHIQDFSELKKLLNSSVPGILCQNKISHLHH
jgi:hypothetical protein